MTLHDRLQGSIALGVLRAHRTLAALIAGLRISGEEIEALEDVVAILERIEAATPASEPSTDANSRGKTDPVLVSPPPYREV